jgi:hypothetical protein
MSCTIFYCPQLYHEMEYRSVIKCAFKRQGKEIFDDILTTLINTHSINWLRRVSGVKKIKQKQTAVKLISVSTENNINNELGMK